MVTPLQYIRLQWWSHSGRPKLPGWTVQWSHLCSTSRCSGGAIQANQNFQAELGLGTGYCIYIWQSWDGREPCSTLLWSALSIHCMPSVFITAYIRGNLSTGGPPECSAGECYNSIRCMPSVFITAYIRGTLVLEDLRSVQLGNVTTASSVTLSQLCSITAYPQTLQDNLTCLNRQLPNVSVQTFVLSPSLFSLWS